MKFELINPMNEQDSIIKQVLTNRGIAPQDIYHYLNLTKNDINSFESLGIENLRAAASALCSTIKENKSALIVVDSDCDGYTSAALLFNYLHLLFPEWVENNLYHVMHEGKEHGLHDILLTALEYDLVIAPDSSSNDYEEHKILKEKGIPCIVLDHHEAEKISSDAIVINNQLSDYPNKSFSGVGITWQFCRYLDQILEVTHSEKFIDLVSLGNTGDMMDMTSFETAYLIREGIKRDNWRNPFIKEMSEYNAYSLGDDPTPIGWAFYVVPFINSMVRSGTQEEKELLFTSMLEWKAEVLVPSTKRGCKGQEERLVTQAVRTSVNVKNRQAKAQDAGMEMLEELIEAENLLSHKVILFQLEHAQIEKNIAGLCANKIMAKYQRPVCVLFKSEKETLPWEDAAPLVTVYSGSARGCELSGAYDFKDLCEATQLVEYAQGHQNAFGLSLRAENIPQFLEITDGAYADVSDERIYKVDKIYTKETLSADDIFDLGECSNLWGSGISEPYVVLQNIIIDDSMIKIYEKRTITINITIDGISFIKFNVKPDMMKQFNLKPNECLKMNIIGYAHINEFNGSRKPQVEIVDFEIITKMWNF